MPIANRHAWYLPDTAPRILSLLVAVAGPLSGSIGSSTKWQIRQGLDDDSLTRLNDTCSIRAHQLKPTAARRDGSVTTRSTLGEGRHLRRSLE